MKLEEALKSTFKNEEHKAFVNIIYTHNVLNEQFQKSLKKHNITAQQYNVLRILRGQSNKAAAMKTIKERLLDKNSDVTRIIDRLSQQNLVKRNAVKLDRRSVLVTITTHGLQILEEIDKCTSEIDTLMATLTQDELITLNQLLDKLRG